MSTFVVYALAFMVVFDPMLLYVDRTLEEYTHVEGRTFTIVPSGMLVLPLFLRPFVRFIELILSILSLLALAVSFVMTLYYNYREVLFFIVFAIGLYLDKGMFESLFVLPVLTVYIAYYVILYARLAHMRLMLSYIPLKLIELVIALYFIQLLGK